MKTIHFKDPLAPPFLRYRAQILSGVFPTQNKYPQWKCLASGEPQIQYPVEVNQTLKMAAFYNILQSRNSTFKPITRKLSDLQKKSWSNKRSAWNLAQLYCLVVCGKWSCSRIITRKLTHASIFRHLIPLWVGKTSIQPRWPEVTWFFLRRAF